METKKCSYCGGEILAAAKKCKHCGKWLNDKKEMINCPVCSEEIEAESEKCVHCNELSSGDKAKSEVLPPELSMSKFPFKSWKVLRFIMPIFFLPFIGGIKLIAKGQFGEEHYEIYTAIMGLLIGIMFFFLSSYVRTISKKNSFRFTFLAILQVALSILSSFLLFALDDDYVGEIDLILGGGMDRYIYNVQFVSFKIGKSGCKRNKTFRNFYDNLYCNRLYRTNSLFNNS